MTIDTRIRPRCVVHCGSVNAAAFVIDVGLLGHAEASRRVLSAWEAGATLLELDATRWILQLSGRRRVMAEACPGAPLTQSAGSSAVSLFSAPLGRRETELLEAPPGSLVLVEGSRASPYALRDSPRIEPAVWLDVDAWQVAVGASFDVSTSQASLPEVAQASVRDLFGDAVPQPAAAQRKLLAELMKHSGDVAASDGASVAEGVRSTWSRLRELVLGGLATLRRVAGSRSHVRSASPTAATTPAPWLTRLRDWVTERVNRAIYWSRLVNLLGSRHARYLRDMVDMFERGDLDEALRHAIPLDGAETERALRLALTPPARRTSLQITTRGTQASTVLPLGDNLLSMLRERYRTSARQLEARGRIEEAAFVWAELLNDATSAVALLERSGMLRKAAELAEGRELDPGSVVRLWLLAGDVERALTVARRHQAFASAVAQLTRRGPPERVAQLRLLWGDSLARAGDYLAAADALWPVPQARNLVREFLQRAAESGGAPRGRALARLLHYDAVDARDALTQASAELCSPEQTVLHLAFAQALLEAPATPVTRRAANLTARALLLDEARGLAGLGRTIDRLVDLSADSALRADMPARRSIGTSTLATRTTPLELSISADDRGTLPVYDVLLLNDGKLCVALGDAGIRIYRGDGRCVAVLSTPARELIPNAARTRTIALMRRGQVVQLSRVDLVARQAEAWCHAELDCHAPEFDGTRWFVAVRDALLAIDVVADDYRSLFRASNLTGMERDGIVEIAHGTDTLEVLLSARRHDRYWRYELSSMKLRERSHPADATRYGSIELRSRLRGNGRPMVALIARPESDEDDDRMMVYLCEKQLEIRLEPLLGFAEQTALCVRGSFAAAALWSARLAAVYLVSLDSHRVVAHVALEHAGDINLRLGEEDLAICDALGRVRVLSLRDGRILSDLRIGA